METGEEMERGGAVKFQRRHDESGKGKNKRLGDRFLGHVDHAMFIADAVTHMHANQVNVDGGRRRYREKHNAGSGVLRQNEGQNFTRDTHLKQETYIAYRATSEKIQLRSEWLYLSIASWLSAKQTPRLHFMLDLLAAMNTRYKKYPLV